METKSNVNIEDKHDIRSKKEKLLNVVCACLIHEPNYYSSADENKKVIETLVEAVAATDPEFIFKVALYLRDDLNIRSTSNYILALAANIPACHPFIKFYFNASTRLPTDVLDIIALYESNRVSPGHGLPSSLRKAIESKFKTFDTYQLAKYNKEPSQQKKKKKNNNHDNHNDNKDNDNSEKPATTTLKQLVRRLHIAEPAETVMGLVGKKYPMDEEAFRKTGLSGAFDPSRAGKRMKLPTPETWETQLSALGNKHTTWETLLDHRKLPFMAMLRNLRNMIVTGISPAHHEMVLAKLTDERSVINSRQLPWRFLSAHDAVDVDLEKMMNDILDHDGSGEKIIQVKVKGKRGAAMGKMRTIRKRVIIPTHMPDLPLIQRYREAIDTAIKIATLNNLPTIEGHSVVFCDVSGSMNKPCSTSGKNMSSIQSVLDVAILLGLMIQTCSEQCNFKIFSSPGETTGKRCDIAVELQENTILGNIKRVREAAEQLGGGTDFPYDYMEELIAKKVHIDHMIILSDMMISPDRSDVMACRGHTVASILEQYRSQVNPNMIFICVDLYGRGTSIVNEGSDLNVLISGFSDQILRFIAERGSHKQLEYVENIDKTKNIVKSITVEKKQE